MIEIAGGIVLAVIVLFLLLILLPYIVVGVSGLAVVGALVAVVWAAIWFISTLSSPDLSLLFAIVTIVAAIFFVWLHYEIKARRLSQPDR